MVLACGLSSSAHPTGLQWGLGQGTRMAIAIALGRNVERQHSEHGPFLLYSPCTPSQKRRINKWAYKVDNESSYNIR
jgi:hypothetical protein